MIKNKNLYPDVDSSPNFAKIEEKIIEFWNQNGVFEESIASRNIQNSNISLSKLYIKEKTSENHDIDKIENSRKSPQVFDPEVKTQDSLETTRPKTSSNEFIFYDGPPFANGLPHYGHLLTGFIKDTVARYQTIKGKKVERRFGWDCHGLPAEMGAEKELGISGRLSITNFGIEKFNNHCKLSVMKFADEWEKYVNRQARWVDFKNSYKTMDISFMESVLWAFKELYKKGLIYESMRVMPYSWACETPLSNFETKLDNSYRERADKSVTCIFKIKGVPKFLQNSANLRSDATCSILAWTTTPWTLPSNLALAVNPNITYIAIQVPAKSQTTRTYNIYIIAKFALDQLKKDLKIDDSEIIAEFTGKSIVGTEYEPIFDYFKDHKNSFHILDADFVTEGEGTGIVHLAPGFGEDDQIICQKHNIQLVCPVDNSGKFTKEIYDFEGRQVFDTIDDIIRKLKNQGSWIKTEQYLHNYPHCWRTDTPLIFKAVPSWYVKVTEFKDRMVELNQQINWIPSHIKDGMFGKWLENARDWSISRNRFWGTPIPIWKSDDPNYPRIDVYGSIEELEKDFGVKIKDLHRPFIDSLTRPNPNDPSGKSRMRRVEDVFDCWFESGSMPYGQVHYPFENKEWFENHFPADFIVEYSAQVRGWFYTLMVLSTALFDRPPFLNCMCHGVILDSSGQKLSKRLNNFADPFDIFNKYGADSMRFAMLSSNVSKGQELLIDKEGMLIYESMRLYIKPIWSAYNFFALYGNIDEIKGEISYESENILDQYILSKLKISISSIDTGLASYDMQEAYKSLSDFFEVLNNWYIRRSRSRFWQSEKNQDKISAYNTLYTCLEHMMRAISPILPIISEEIYIGINRGVYAKTNSVHLSFFPDSNQIPLYQDLVHKMDVIRDICSSALFLRNQKNLRVRQPLSNLQVILPNSSDLSKFKSIIMDEINVKNVEFNQDLEQYADLKLSINFKELGKKLPDKIKDIISESKKGNWIKDGEYVIIAGQKLTSEDCEVVLYPKETNDKSAKATKALSYSHGLVIIDTHLTEELRQEGFARDVIRLVQSARKDAGLEVTDKISLSLNANSNEITDSVSKFQSLIEEQTLSEVKARIDNPVFSTKSEIEGKILEIFLEKLC
ncbi:MAG: isoleucine--tRNA ligase [Rickettsiaceae bacterium]|nr:isoleucine--tRNA ligase [Rickettsiaceae bacterium]